MGGHEKNPRMTSQQAVEQKPSFKKVQKTVCT